MALVDAHFPWSEGSDSGLFWGRPCVNGVYKYAVSSGPVRASTLRSSDLLISVLSQLISDLPLYKRTAGIDCLTLFLPTRP